MNGTVEKRIYIKVLFGFLITVPAVLFSVAINDFPEIHINGPFKWFNPREYAYLTTFVISLIVTAITAILQIEVETRLYLLSSIINGYNFNETITNFLKKSATQKTSIQNIISSDNFNYLYLDKFPERILTIESSKIILVSNILTFIAVVSSLLNLIFLIIKYKSKSKRVKIKILSENLNSSRNLDFENFLENDSSNESSENKD